MKSSTWVAMVMLFEALVVVSQGILSTILYSSRTVCKWLVRYRKVCWQITCFMAIMVVRGLKSCAILWAVILKIEQPLVEVKKSLIRLILSLEASRAFISALVVQKCDIIKSEIAVELIMSGINLRLHSSTQLQKSSDSKMAKGSSSLIMRVISPDFTESQVNCPC